MSQDILTQSYEMLNSEQKKAVDTIYGPVMVVAGPGTGKTQIIARRTAEILLKTDTNPENILITTFTEAGVIAIKKRLKSFLGVTGYSVKVATFHSFASEIIQDFPEKFIEQRALGVIDEIESYEILQDILYSNITSGEIQELFTPTDKDYYLASLKSSISKLKQEGVSPEKLLLSIKNQRQIYDQNLAELPNNKRIRDLEKRLETDTKKYDTHIAKLKELLLIYRQYQEIIFEKGYYDFADMITFVTQKLESDDELQSTLREKYQFLMIDEFQDTNNAQNAIIDIIAGDGNENPNIMVVGDDDQSIYRFQGANIENILNFVGKYPNTQIVVLKDNYRSSQSILDIASSLIENNQNRISNKIESVDKNIIAKGKYSELDQNFCFSFENDIKEKFFILKEIQKLQAQNTDATFAILVKKNQQVKDWGDFFKNFQTPISSRNQSNILSNHFVLFFLKILSIIDDVYSDDEALLDIMRSHFTNIENIDVIAISRFLYQESFKHKKFPKGVWDILSDIEENSELGTNLKDIEKIISFRDQIISLDESLATYGLRSFFHTLLEEFGLYEYIEKYGNFDDLQDIFTLINTFKGYIEKNKEINLKTLLRKISLYKQFNISIPRESLYAQSTSIEILTAHTSKGLEYDYVFIPEFYNGNWKAKARGSLIKFPLGMSGDGLQYLDMSQKEIDAIEKEIALEEERRLLFVALTRAKQSLYITFANSKENKPLLESPFLIETGLIAQEKDVEISVQEENQILLSQVGENPFYFYDEREFEYISNFFENYKLSATDLNRFLEDPKLFLRSSVYKYPFLSNEALIFGNVYHKVLEIAHIEKKKKNILSLISLKELFEKELFKYHLTLDEFERILKKGLESLEGYYEIFSKNPRETLFLEYNFGPKEVYFGDIPLTGKIDKIEILGEGGIGGDDFLGQGSLFKQSIAIVDYKTGRSRTLGEIKGIDRYGNKKQDLKQGGYYRQLMFYKLLVENTKQFSQNYEIGEFALDFIEGKDGKFSYLPVEILDEDFEDFKQLIEKSREQMRDINFWREVLEK